MIGDLIISGITNLYGMAPSPTNFIEPQKCPLSSMSPAIVIDKNGDAVFIAGTAGGTRIPTTMAYVRFENISIIIFDLIAY